LNFDTQPIERLTACLINVYYEFKEIEIEQVDVLFIEEFNFCCGRHDEHILFLTCEYEKSEKQKTITSFGSKCPFWENPGLNAGKTSSNCQIDFLKFLY